MWVVDVSKLEANLEVVVVVVVVVVFLADVIFSQKGGGDREKVRGMASRWRLWTP